MWVTRTQQFDISNVPNINTVHSDFCPAFFKDELVFVSERSPDIVNFNTYSWDNQPYLNVYSTKMEKGADGNTAFSKKVKSFSSRINTNYHDGPVCFNAEQNTMYLTRVNYVLNKKDKNFVNLPKIYISTLKGKSWSKVTPFQYNREVLVEQIFMFVKKKATVGVNRKT